MTQLIKALAICSLAALAVFMLLFLQHNHAGMTGLPLILLLSGAYLAAYALVVFRVGRESVLPGRTGLNALIAGLAIVALVYIVLDNVVLDYYQPISTSEPGAQRISIFA